MISSDSGYIPLTSTGKVKTQTDMEYRDQDDDMNAGKSNTGSSGTATSWMISNNILFPSSSIGK